MAYGLMIFAVVTLLRGLNVEDDPLFKTRQPPLEKLYILGLILQVSGWTKRRYFTEATSYIAVICFVYKDEEVEGSI